MKWKQFSGKHFSPFNRLGFRLQEEGDGAPGGAEKTSLGGDRAPQEGDRASAEGDRPPRRQD